MNRRTGEDLGVKGYSPPRKSAIPTYRDPEFSKRKKSFLFEDLKKRRNEPD